MDILEKVDIAELIEESGVGLDRAGRLYRGLCPFHADKSTPSLAVYPSSNSWVCFSTACGSKANKLNGGSAIDWVAQLHGLSVGAAIRWLEERYGDRDARPVYTPNSFKNQGRPAEPKPVAPDKVVYWAGWLWELEERLAYFRNRGFTDETIRKEGWGWTGSRYSIPVWEGVPFESDCLGVRLRRAGGEEEGPKYIGLKGYNLPTVWGRAYCQDAEMCLGFAGELDAARAVQDNFPAFSLVNGVGALRRFPEEWPSLWFPNTKYLVAVFDKKEELEGARLAAAWNKVKGPFTGRVYHWPLDFEGKDYCEWRDAGNSAGAFFDNLLQQLGA